MKTIVLSGFYISDFEWFMILLVFLGIFSALVAVIGFVVRKTTWYRKNTSKHKFAISILIACFWRYYHSLRLQFYHQFTRVHFLADSASAFS